MRSRMPALKFQMSVVMYTSPNCGSALSWKFRSTSKRERLYELTYERWTAKLIPTSISNLRELLLYSKTQQHHLCKRALCSLSLLHLCWWQWVMEDMYLRICYALMQVNDQKWSMVKFMLDKLLPVSLSQVRYLGLLCFFFTCKNYLELILKTCNVMNIGVTLKETHSADLISDVVGVWNQNLMPSCSTDVRRCFSAWRPTPVMNLDLELSALQLEYLKVRVNILGC